MAVLILSQVICINTNAFFWFPFHSPFSPCFCCWFLKVTLKWFFGGCTVLFSLSVSSFCTHYVCFVHSAAINYINIQHRHIQPYNLDTLMSDYTFLSPVHHARSPLDCFEVSSSIMKDITDTHIHLINISGHVPVSVSLTQETVTPPIKNWRLNTPGCIWRTLDMVINLENVC